MKEVEKYNDNTLMPWGEHKGKALINCPASYLLWLYDQPWIKGPLKEYIKDNFQSLKQEIKK